MAPFVGRETELAELFAWCLGEKQGEHPLRLYVAGGGIGKTRLMLRACERLRDEYGWLAGFLDRQFDGWPEEAVKGLVESEVPKLIVLDYADTQIDAAVVLLQRLNARPKEAAPVRVVLLAREGPQDVRDMPTGRSVEVPWIAELKRRSGAAQALIADLRAIGLTPLANDVSARKAAFVSAQKAFAEAQNLPLTEEFAGSATAQPDLSGETFERISSFMPLHSPALKGGGSKMRSGCSITSSSAKSAPGPAASRAST